MRFTVGQLAELVHGQVQGDAEQLITAARPLGDAQTGDITFLEHEKNAHHLHQSKASAAVVPLQVPANGMALIRVADPLAAFIAIVRQLTGRDETVETAAIDARASIHPTARLGEKVSLGPFAVVGVGSVLGDRCRLYPGAVVGKNCRLGDDVILFPNVVLYDDTVLGHRVIVHANAVLGADGFGYRLHQGRHVKVPQLGRVEVGDDVEIGACTTIDRGTFEPTRIGEGTKIDNLVQVGHNCRIGKHNLFVSQMGIAGSSSTGDYVVVAGQVGIADHVHIGDQAVLGARCGVPRDVPAGQRMLGAPCTPEREQKRILLTLEKLPEMRKDLQKIKQHLGWKDEGKS